MSYQGKGKMDVLEALNLFVKPDGIFVKKLCLLCGSQRVVPL